MWVLPLDENADAGAESGTADWDARYLFRTPFAERQPTFSPDGRMMAVSVATDGDAFRADTPRELFDDPLLLGAFGDDNSFHYDVMPDGSQFLILQPGSGTGAAPAYLRVVENWFEELNELAPFPEGWL